MLRDQVMLQNVEHQVFIPEKLDVDLFLLASWVDVSGGFLFNGDWWYFSFWFGSSNDEELLDFGRGWDKVFDFVLWNGDWIGWVFFRIEVHEDGIWITFALHGIFVLLVFVFLNLVKGLFFPIVLLFVFGVLFECHIFLVGVNTVASGLHDFEDGFVDLEVFALWVGFVFLEFVLHWR